MKTFLNIIFILSIILIHQSCNQSKTNAVDFNPRDEYSLINTEIAENKLNSVETENYTYWLKNNEIVKLYVFEGDGENYATREEYYFKYKKVFAIQKQSICFPNALDYRVLLLFKNEDLFDGDYWIENNKKNKKELINLLEMRGLNFQNEIILDSQTNKPKGKLTIGDLTTRFNINLNKSSSQSNSDKGYSFQSLSELRGMVISASIRNMKKRLGEPNESMGADDYLLKYHNWKPFSVYSANRTMYSLVFVYENLLEKPVVVIFNNHNGKVFDVMYKDEIKSFEDLAVNYGND